MAIGHRVVLWLHIVQHLATTSLLPWSVFGRCHTKGVIFGKSSRIQLLGLGVGRSKLRRPSASAIV